MKKTLRTTVLEAINAEITNTLLKLNYPCHGQTAKRYVKVVTEASAQVVKFERNCLVRHFYCAYLMEIQSSLSFLVL